MRSPPIHCNLSPVREPKAVAVAFDAVQVTMIDLGHLKVPKPCNYSIAVSALPPILGARMSL
jgi:hypothetical protein